MIVLGYVSALLIGLSLGLIGGGGSILTIPVLVYIYKLSPTAATGYSLFIVGSTSFAGAIKKYRLKQVDIQTAVYFSITSVITVFLTRKYIIKMIPEQLFTFGNYIITKSFLIMILFAIIMIFVSLKMILDKTITLTEELQNYSPNVFKIILSSMIIGLLTGFLGAGGGFIIIPTLIFLFRLPMKMAIGTSLTIIAFNSLIGFLGDVMNESHDWVLLLSFSIIAVAGVLLGSELNKIISGKALKKAFGWFVLIVGIYIISREML